MNKGDFLEKLKKTKDEWRKQVTPECLDYAYGGNTDAYIRGIVSTTKLGSESEYIICSCDEFFELSEKEFDEMMLQNMFEEIEFGIFYKSNTQWR